MPKTLYICYFGVREPLVQTQVIPYLLEIAKDGVGISLLTFEPTPLSEAESRAVREELAGIGIKWYSLRYHKRISVIATAYDVLQGVRLIRRLLSRERYDILHCRVHIPMLMAALSRKFSKVKPKLLFDIRGFFPEEYTDAGVWEPDGFLYRTVKRVERWLMKEADGFVILTEKAREIVFPGTRGGENDSHGRPIEVIPCCVGAERFKNANPEAAERVRQEIGADDRFIMTYVGSFGGWYVAEETADFYGALKSRKKDAFALILTQSKPELIEPLLIEQGYSANDYWIGRVPAADIPDYLIAADAAVSFAKPCYSKIATSPTKNAEYLTCGLPIVANDGIGDTTQQLTDDKTGVVISEFNTAAYNDALDKLDDLMSNRDGLAARCRESAERRFDLETVGGRRYRRLYRKLLG
jgi:glycosyltransferase involved in cell wall biosynthesis